MRAVSLLQPRFFALALLALAGAGCAQMPRPDLSIGQRDASERLNIAIQALNEGREDRAQAQLRRILEEQPNNREARSLMDQIERDPVALLGRSSRSYTAREGDSMSSLASRFLGDPLMFYALSRYNGIETPSSLAAGRPLRIPERARATRERAPTRTAAAPAASPPSAARDPARANSLRATALARINNGQIDEAVQLLRQARALDSDNAAIQRDLDRALRIQNAVGRRS